MLCLIVESFQGGSICGLGKAHMRSAASPLKKFAQRSLETLPLYRVLKAWVVGRRLYRPLFKSLLFREDDKLQLLVAWGVDACPPSLSLSLSLCLSFSVCLSVCLSVSVSVSVSVSLSLSLSLSLLSLIHI